LNIKREDKEKRKMEVITVYRARFKDLEDRWK